MLSLISSYTIFLTYLRMYDVCTIVKILLICTYKQRDFLHVHITIDLQVNTFEKIMFQRFSKKKKSFKSFIC